MFIVLTSVDVLLPNQDASSLVMVNNSFPSLDTLFSNAPITIVDVMTCVPYSICNNHTPDIAQHCNKKLCIDCIISIFQLYLLHDKILSLF